MQMNSARTCRSPLANVSSSITSGRADTLRSDHEQLRCEQVYDLELRGLLILQLLSGRPALLRAVVGKLAAGHVHAELVTVQRPAVQLLLQHRIWRTSGAE